MNLLSLSGPSFIAFLNILLNCNSREIDLTQCLSQCHVSPQRELFLLKRNSIDLLRASVQSGSEGFRLFNGTVDSVTPPLQSGDRLNQRTAYDGDGAKGVQCSAGGVGAG